MELSADQNLEANHDSTFNNIGRDQNISASLEAASTFGKHAHCTRTRLVGILAGHGGTQGGNLEYRIDIEQEQVEGIN